MDPVAGGEEGPALEQLCVSGEGAGGGAAEGPGPAPPPRPPDALQPPQRPQRQGAPGCPAASPDSPNSPATAAGPVRGGDAAAGGPHHSEEPAPGWAASPPRGAPLELLFQLPAPRLKCMRFDAGGDIQSEHTDGKSSGHEAEHMECLAARCERHLADLPLASMTTSICSQAKL